ATFVIMIALPVLLGATGESVVADVLTPIGYSLIIWGTALYTWTGVLYTYKASIVAKTIPRSQNQRVS
ncbi:MAG: CDP-alcohol phosphatidyltransferase family protein, partial [Rhodococcus sp. (in: high G+C Gram-positive bacteria)]